MLKKSQNLKKAKALEPENKKILRPTSVQLSQVIMAVALICCVVMSGVIIYFANDTFVTQKQHKNLNELTQQHAKNIAALVGRQVSGINKDIAFYTTKSDIEKALRDNDKSALLEIKKRIAQNIESIESVQIFRVDEAKLNLDINPPIRFSELNLISNAQGRAELKTEFSSIKGKKYYNLAVPIPADTQSQVLGTMLVRFNIVDFRKVLLDASASLGKISLFQNIPGVGETLIAVEGTESPQGRPFAQRENVEGTYFIISVAPSDDVVAQSNVDPLFIYSVACVVALLLSIFVLLCAKSIANKLTKKAVEKKVGKAKETKKRVSVLDDADGLRAVLEVEFTEDDEALLGLEDEPEPASSKKHVTNPVEDEKARAENERKLPSHIFRAYDIRGIAKEEITKEIAQQIGQAIGSEVLYAGESSVIVARDARIHSPELTEYLIRGILSTGCNVTNVGTVPTPLLYFATHTLDVSNSGVMVTASHNPSQYNGFKIIIDGKMRAQEDLTAIRSRILNNNVEQGSGEESRLDIVTPYIDAIFSDVALAGEISMVIDAANGVSGVVAPKLFEELGCHVTPLYCDLDGNFPNHDPDPSVEKNLQALVEKVKETRADLGIAFDGDGDRVVAITPKGKIIWPDRLLMLFAKDIVSRNPGADVVFDVKSTRLLNQCITEYGGRPILWKTGHSHMKNKMQETGAILGGEYSGHIFIKDRWFGFDDGLYAAARLIEIMSLQGETLDQIIDAFPESISTPEIRITVPEKNKFAIIDKLIATGDFGEAKLTTIDGLRADFKNGWGLARASNTSGALTLRFEADTDKDLLVIKSLFVRELKKVDNTIDINWE